MELYFAVARWQDLEFFDALDFETDVLISYAFLKTHKESGMYASKQMLNYLAKRNKRQKIIVERRKDDNHNKDF